jgi:hypothetical protein
VFWWYLTHAIGLFVGGPLIFASVIIMTRDITVGICSAKHWTLHIGITLVLMSLALKNYRLHFIFNRKVFCGVEKPPSDIKLLLILILSLLPDIILLLVWNAISPFNESSAEAGHCESEHSTIFMSLLYVTKVPSILICLYLSYSLRKLHAIFNESSRLRFIVFNIGLIGLPLLVLSLVGAETNSPLVVRMAQALCLLYGVSAATIVMLVPRFQAIQIELMSSKRHRLTHGGATIGKINDGNINNTNNSSHTSSNATDTSSVTRIYGAPMTSPAVLAATATDAMVTTYTPASATPIGGPSLLPNIITSPTGKPTTTGSAWIGENTLNAPLTSQHDDSSLMSPSTTRQVPQVISPVVIGVTIPQECKSNARCYEDQLQRRTAVVNHLQFKLRELKKSTETTQGELDAAENDMHAAYLEHEFQHMRRSLTTSIRPSKPTAKPSASVVVSSVPPLAIHLVHDQQQQQQQRVLSQSLAVPTSMSGNNSSPINGNVESNILMHPTLTPSPVPRPVLLINKASIQNGSTTTTMNNTLSLSSAEMARRQSVISSGTSLLNERLGLGATHMVNGYGSMLTNSSPSPLPSSSILTTSRLTSSSTSPLPLLSTSTLPLPITLPTSSPLSSIVIVTSESP